jgi:F0F1-type ATP synthase assembly protein I
MDQTVDVNARLHLVRYGGVYRIAGVLVVGFALGVGWVIGGAAHRKPVFVVFGIVLLGLCVPMLIGAIRVWRASRAVAAASQGRPPDGRRSSWRW